MAVSGLVIEQTIAPLEVSTLFFPKFVCAVVSMFVVPLPVFKILSATCLLEK